MKKTMLFAVVAIAASVILAAAIATAGEPPAKVEPSGLEAQGHRHQPYGCRCGQGRQCGRADARPDQARDAEWQKSPGVTKEMQALIDNACGKYLHGLQKEMPFLAEAFVMDNQGANVAMTDKTSDYWQGDEPKWQESFKGGAGAVHVSDVKFDDSTQTYTVQVSVPVMDGGKAIGAITFGVDVDQVQ
ncbi:MAG: PDC sensor domain-containing protein [bacterium]|nr:PDC sensor domain-containing protein [bacterium]